MKCIETVDAMKKQVFAWQQAQQKIGFVATMGHLHQGHGFLLERAKSENDVVVLSIFVNPSQFNDPEDFKHYPKTPEQDLAFAKDLGVDVVFMPDAKAMYPDQAQYKVKESIEYQRLEGACRPGHFDGMLTIVLKLLLLISPQHAYFGEKDYQQWQLVEGLCRAFLLDVKIIGCPTQREEDGLALSSRNSKLSAQERKQAAWIHRIIQSPISGDAMKQQLQEQGFRLEYVEKMAGRILVAVYLGQTRLIDNVVDKAET